MPALRVVPCHHLLLSHGVLSPQHPLGGVTWLLCPTCLCRLDTFPLPASPRAGLGAKQEQNWRPASATSIPAQVTATLSMGRCGAANRGPYSGLWCHPKPGTQGFQSRYPDLRNVVGMHACTRSWENKIKTKGPWTLPLQGS